MAKRKKDIKCIVWDLDNTVWNGILLESPKVSLKPGIKSIIKELDSRGILHSIASKNNSEDAINKLKEFEIDQYFLYPEIHWNAKSSSLENIRQNLNIGMDTILFIDDQEYEREEVKSVHAEVTCLDASEYIYLLTNQRLNPKFITQDSKRRRLMYIEDNERNKVEKGFNGPETEFLESLNMSFVISEAKEEDLKRAEELTERTNQLNSTGITFDYDELKQFMESDEYKLYICELSDKFGTYGKIGLALVEQKEMYDHLKLILMSCRVISRGVGTVLISYIMQEAKNRDKKLLADFRKTDRNRMMYVSYRFANFKEAKQNENDILFENDLSIIPTIPPYINVQIN